MIIVSQNKIRIIDITGKDIEINNPETWNQGFWSIDTYPNCNDSQKYHLRLGIYKTEERAKEVLEEIIQKIEDVSWTNLMDNLQIAMHDKNFGGALSSIYRMPEE